MTPTRKGMPDVALGREAFRERFRARFVDPAYDAVARELSGEERDAVYARVKELCPRILTYPIPARRIPVFELQRR